MWNAPCYDEKQKKSLWITGDTKTRLNFLAPKACSLQIKKCGFLYTCGLDARKCSSFLVPVVCELSSHPLKKEWMYLLEGKSRLARPKVSVVQPRCWLVPQEHSDVVERKVVQVELFWSSVVYCKECLWSWHCWAGWCCKWSAWSDVAQSLLALPSCCTCHKFPILIVNFFQNDFFFSFSPYCYWWLRETELVVCSRVQRALRVTVTCFCDDLSVLFTEACGLPVVYTGSYWQH